MTPRPEISVVIPVYNGEAYLAEAIESVLAQSLPPAEVVVIDNGCTDASRQIATGFGPAVRVVSIPHGPAPAARNVGVEHATRELLAFNDADDVWEPCRLAAGVDALRGPQRPDLVFGHVHEFQSPELSEAQRADLPAARGVVPGLVIITLLCELATFRRVGPFNADLPAADFLDWLSRARGLGCTERMLDTVVARRRVHTANTSWTSRSSDLTTALRAAIQRRARANEAQGG